MEDNAKLSLLFVALLLLRFAPVVLVPLAVLLLLLVVVGKPVAPGSRGGLSHPNWMDLWVTPTTSPEALATPPKDRAADNAMSSSLFRVVRL